MAKKNIPYKINVSEEIKLQEFKRYFKAEGFSEMVSKRGNFKPGTPLFYKRATIDKFLVFNIPFYGVQKKFYADFWVINAISEKDFLVKHIADNNLHDIRLGFTLENIDIYKNQLSALQS